jgi:hypothetical protein
MRSANLERLPLPNCTLMRRRLDVAVGGAAQQLGKDGHVTVILRQFALLS